MTHPSPPDLNTHPTRKRPRPLKLTGALLTTALALTACGGGADDAGATNSYDQPEEIDVAVAADNYNEVASETGSMNLSMDEFETMSKTQVCDRLPATPSQEDLVDLAYDLEEEHDLHNDAALALIVHGGGRWCSTTIDAAFN